MFFSLMRHKWFQLLSILTFTTSSFAVQLDWSGQFWFDNHWLNNYQLDRSRPASDNDIDMINRGGTYVPGRGQRNVVWYTAFLKLKPKVIVNDSINIKTELHVGSPAYGFLGRGYPSSGDARHDISGSQKDGMSITAQRYWANLITDFGTLELGRAPIHWGLGAIWNSGDNLFDKFQSTGDMIRLTSKFGNFWLMPSITKVAVGRNVAGATDPTGVNTVEGDDDITDINLAAKYDNPEEDFEFGIMWTKRAGNVAQSTLAFHPSGNGSRRLSYNIYDFYAKKKLGRYSFGIEFPLFNGNIGAIDGAKEYEYRTFAAILEGTYTSDLWDINLKAGHVPGQQGTDPVAGQTLGAEALGGGGDTTYRAVYLNKDYKLGLIMFNYNLYGLGQNNPDVVASASLNNPYDATIVNANYISLNPVLKLEKWTLKWNVIFAYATQTASANKNFYNHQARKFYSSIDNQSKFLGKEFDFGIGFKWDENFILSWDMGMWFPGSYYKFTNHPIHKSSDPSMMWASLVRAGITF